MLVTWPSISYKKLCLFRDFAISLHSHNIPVSESLQVLLMRSFTKLFQHIPRFTPKLNMQSFKGLPVIPDEAYTTTSPRKIAQVVLAVEKEEGAGMRVRRSIGTPRLQNLTPFLMLDHFDSSFGGAAEAGAPDHPHRVCNPIIPHVPAEDSPQVT
jgi:hypothetical protein